MILEFSNSNVNRRYNSDFDLPGIKFLTLLVLNLIVFLSYLESDARKLYDFKDQRIITSKISNLAIILTQRSTENYFQGLLNLEITLTRSGFNASIFCYFKKIARKLLRRL